MQFFASKSIVDLEISHNPSGWGPISGEKLTNFGEIPYAHFDKKDKIGRHSDFVSTQYNPKMVRYRRDDGNVNAEFAYRHDAVEDSTFQLVDNNSKSSKPRKFGNQIGRGGRGFNSRGPKKAQELQATFSTFKNMKGRNTAGQNKGRGSNTRNVRRQKVDRAPSLAVSSDWAVIEEFDLSQLLKLVANTPKVEDLLWCGHVDLYNDVYEKINSRTAKPLKKDENKIFYAVTTKDDPIMENFLVDDIGDVYVTDSILSTLVAAPRSVNSWDIVIEKADGKIFLDKRGPEFDLLTVSETAQEPPTANEDIEEFNHPIKLSNEATAINQNFSQQVLVSKSSDRKTFEKNPFYVFEDEPEAEPASVAYRYRKFTLGDIRLVVRCEIHGYAKKPSHPDQFFTCYSLNEWDSKYSGGMNWRQKIDGQRGAVLGTEIKNNSCKLAKWAVQSLLSDADLMKIGYVSRVNPSNPSEHVILSTQTFKPKEFSLQINLNPTNIWGIIKMFCELLMKKEDGKYVLIKDPNKSTIRLYAVPPETFEEDKEAGDGDDFDANDDDDD